MGETATAVMTSPTDIIEIVLARIRQRTYVSHGPATYHLASTSHGHLACENCGAIADVPAEAFLSLAETAMAMHGFVISPGHFAVPGRCANCR